MKLLFVSLSIVTLLGLVVPTHATAQAIGSDFGVDANTVKQNQAAILACASDFTEDGVTKAVTLLRIQQKGASGLNPESAHSFVVEYVRGACQTADCRDVVVQVLICAQLTGYGDLPF